MTDKLDTLLKCIPASPFRAALTTEIESLRAEIARLRAVLEMAVTQNESDMLMSGEELRKCRAALKAHHD